MNRRQTIIFNILVSFGMSVVMSFFMSLINVGLVTDLMSIYYKSVGVGFLVALPATAIIVPNSKHAALGLFKYSAGWEIGVGHKALHEKETVLCLVGALAETEFRQLRAMYAVVKERKAPMLEHPELNLVQRANKVAAAVGKIVNGNRDRCRHEAYTETLHQLFELAEVFQTEIDILRTRLHQAEHIIGHIENSVEGGVEILHRVNAEIESEAIQEK